MAYDAQIALALRLIEQYGAPLTITRRVPAVPASGDRPATPPLVIVASCVGVILTAKQKLKSADGLAPGTLQGTSERVVFIAGGGITLQVSGGTFSDRFEPTALDQLLISGRRYTVRGNDPLSPDDGPVVILHRTFVTT